MPKYEVRAIESREYIVTYHVEAIDEAEARCMIEEGTGHGVQVDWKPLDDSEQIEFIDSCEQIDSTENGEPCGVINHYRCPECQTEWTDEWDCACDDKCPECGCRNISPYDSVNSVESTG
jgi:hypothetical protein